MDYIRKTIYGPTPQEQFRTCQQTLRKNKRQMDRQINELNAIERKTKSLIKQAAKKNDSKAVKSLAGELLHTKRINSKMNVSKAILNSIELKLNEQQQLIKIKGSMQKSTEIMRDMSNLINLPQVGRIFNDLSRELTKSGVIEEMVTDMMDLDVLDDELESEDEEDINVIINEVLGESKSSVESKLDQITPTPVVESNTSEPFAQEEEDDDDELLLNMRQRLSALQQ